MITMEESWVALGMQMARMVVTFFPQSAWFLIIPTCTESSAPIPLGQHTRPGDRVIGMQIHLFILHGFP